MRWLLDQGLPRGIVPILRAARHDAVHVGDLGMAAATDLEILRRGEAEMRVVVTLDADFHTLLATSGGSRPSVIRIREEGLKAPEAASLILAIHAGFSEALSDGSVLVYSRGVVRARRLPLVS